MNFQKGSELFPVKNESIYLNNCGVAPQSAAASLATAGFSLAHSARGAGVFEDYGNTMAGLHQAAAALLQTHASNISFVRNTAEALSLLANGYRFAAGDEIISYVYEYPSNHYPWKMQEKRGVTLKLLPDYRPPESRQLKIRSGQPVAFSLADLETMVTAQTRIVAVSHVQFTSGFAVQLEQLAQFCHERKIDLVVDAAQSLGALPLYPEKWKIAAVAASGWKWLLGPLGSGLLYTSPEFREKVADIMAGADLMQQGDNYLDHSWNPYRDGRRFEYSTVSLALAVGMKAGIEQIFLPYSMEAIRAEIFRLQDLFVAALDQSKHQVLLFAPENRSGILSLICPDPQQASRRLKEKNIVATVRGEYLRIAPHYYNEDSDLLSAAELLNSL